MARTSKRLKPLSDSDRVLITVLARGDGPHLPMRSHHWQQSPHAPNRYQALQDFAACGVQLASVGAGSANVERQRLLATMSDEGLLTITRAARTKVPWLRLSPAGESRARSLAGLPTLAESLSWLGKLLELAGGNHGRWIWEGAFAPDYNVDEITLTAAMALPALTRGWARTGSTVAGVAAYTLTPAGLAALAADPPPEAADAGLGRDDAAELYYAERFARVQSLGTDAVADPQEIGERPLGLHEIEHVRETK